MNGLHGIIFSYEQEPGLRELAERRMPASIPFGGRYRVVDFMLSNLHAAGITDVGVVLHGNYQSLLDHIGNGKHVRERQIDDEVAVGEHDVVLPYPL